MHSMLVIFIDFVFFLRSLNLLLSLTYLKTVTFWGTDLHKFKRHFLKLRLYGLNTFYCSNHVLFWGILFGDIYHFYWVFSLIFQHKIYHFSKIHQKSALGAPKGRQGDFRMFDGGKFLGWRGPQDQLKIGPFDSKTIQGGSRHAVGPKARRIDAKHIIFIWDCLLYTSDAADE